jgi:hypothetical protein
LLTVENGRLPVKKIRDSPLKGKEVFPGLEDSKKTWNLSGRSGSVAVNRTSKEKYSLSYCCAPHSVVMAVI